MNDGEVTINAATVALSHSLNGNARSTLQIGQTDNVSGTNLPSVFTLSTGSVTAANTNDTTRGYGVRIAAGGAKINTGSIDTATTNGVATISTSISGTGSLENGANPLRLTGNNSYSGGTVVTAGTLIVSGELSSPSNTMTIASGAAFDGGGFIGGDLFLASGAKFVSGLTDTITLGIDATATFGGFGISDLIGLNDSVEDGPTRSSSATSTSPTLPTRRSRMPWR